jgi:hypothetical protein
MSLQNEPEIRQSVLGRMDTGSYLSDYITSAQDPA